MYGNPSYHKSQHRIFLTGWEEEMYNDRMGIYKPNPITDFIIDEPGRPPNTARKRQRIENIPPLQASDLRRQGNVDPHHWLTIDN